MLRKLVSILGLLVSASGFASQESSMSLLDNRFRVDPSVEQMTFVIYRADNSQPVVLVRPDGKKYYASRFPDNVRWYQESSMDIISVDNPMPGPWQAIGKVTPKNKIKLISNLKLEAQPLPERLFEGEELKFTARLTSDDQPLVLRDFLDRVNLKVTFTKYIESVESLSKDARPIPIELGVFEDDGQGLDEQAGDGVFTVSLPITAQPNKYRVRITSGNGVFLRALEQEVLVYPPPMESTFIQSRNEGTPHQIVFSGEQGMIEPGSVAAHIDHQGPDGDNLAVETRAENGSLKASLDIPYDGQLGNYSWSGMMYATDLASKRSLIFPITNHTYSVVQELDIAESRRLQEEERAKQAQRLQEIRIIQAREDARQRNMLILIIGNLVALVLGILGWFVVRKIKASKAKVPEMQLDMPKS